MALSKSLNNTRNEYICSVHTEHLHTHIIDFSGGELLFSVVPFPILILYFFYQLINCFICSVFPACQKTNQILIGCQPFFNGVFRIKN
ncbi:Uncharacterised protein [Enterobacter cloacae]|nr:Uncharacterised protein [Enterobacter cloacae]